MNIASVKNKYFTAPESTSARINNFNILRFIAAAMVMYGHMGSIMNLPVFSIYGQAVSSVGVKIFFTVSGYLITKSYMNDSNFLRYMTRRCFRIFPALIGVSLFAVLIVGPVTTALPIREYFAATGTKMYFLNVLLRPVYSLPGAFGSYVLPNTVNGSLWSLPAEFTLYIVLVLLLLPLKKVKKPQIGVLVFALLTLAVDVIRTKWFLDYRIVIWGSNIPDWLPLIPFFFVGSFFSFLDKKKVFNLQIATVLMLVTGIFSFTYIKYQILLSFILPYFVLSFAFAERPFFGNWFSKCDFSYGLYLYGFMMQQLLFNKLHNMGYDFSMNVMMLICFTVTLACAAGSWYLIEKPAQNLGKRVLELLTVRPPAEE